MVFRTVRGSRRVSVGAIGALGVMISTSALGQYSVRNLVAESAGSADHADANLVNPWGLAHSATGPWWVANNNTATSTLYDGAGVANALVVSVPGVVGSGAPTGIVFSGSATDFPINPISGTDPARFVFAGEDGVISAWAPGLAAPANTARRMVDRSGNGTVYKGLAVAAGSGGAHLYAADFHHGSVDVFDATFAAASSAGGFVDPGLPAGYAPFNIAAGASSLLVSYALQAAGGLDDLPGAGHGFVDEFNLDGVLQRRVVSAGALNSPWGMVVAPADFGPFGGALLVGNGGDGHINAFDAATGMLVGTLADENGQPIAIAGLRGLAFGNGAGAGPASTLYFTAGGADGAHGLFGSITIPGPGAGVAWGIAIVGWGVRRRRRCVRR